MSKMVILNLRISFALYSMTDFHIHGETNSQRFSWDFWHVTHRHEDKPRYRIKKASDVSDDDDNFSSITDSLADATSVARAVEGAHSDHVDDPCLPFFSEICSVAQLTS